MVLRGAYVIARGAAGRPTCQHRLVDGTSTRIRCSKIKIGLWSRSYQDKPIESVLCRKSACRT